MFFTNIFIRPTCIYTVDGSVEGNDFFFYNIWSQMVSGFLSGALILKLPWRVHVLLFHIPVVIKKKLFYPFQYVRQFNCYMSLTALENIDVMHPIKTDY